MEVLRLILQEVQRELLWFGVTEVLPVQPETILDLAPILLPSVMARHVTSLEHL